MALSPPLRERLSQPFGEVMDFPKALARLSPRPSLLIAVGDQVLFNLIAAGLPPDIAVYDGLSQRRPIEPSVRGRIESASLSYGPLRVRNPPGRIEPELERKCLDALARGRGWLCVDGEDDLAALVLMAHAPEGAVLLYGQPNQGAVRVDASEAVRADTLALLDAVKREQD